jgi:hypothetical protein
MVFHGLKITNAEHVHIENSRFVGYERVLIGRGIKDFHAQNNTHHYDGPPFEKKLLVYALEEYNFDLRIKRK